MVMMRQMIRHAVSIDERRAKFRQDLMYQGSNKHKATQAHHSSHGIHAMQDMYRQRRPASGKPAKHDEKNRQDRPSRGRHDTLAVPDEDTAFRPHSRSRSRAATSDNVSEYSHVEYEYESEDDGEQDIDEVW
jgi:hypothetical protein